VGKARSSTKFARRELVEIMVTNDEQRLAGGPGACNPSREVVDVAKRENRQKKAVGRHKDQPAHHIVE